MTKFGIIRIAAVAMVWVVFCSVVLAGKPELLIRADRRTTSDLTVLREAGLPVIAESSLSLFLEGSETTLSDLNALGFKTSVLDRSPGDWDYLQIGLRPDSDLDAVYAAGAVLFSEENWVLVRVPRGIRHPLLETAKVFVSRFPHKPVALATAPPLPVRDGEARDGAGFPTPNPIIQRMVASVSSTDIQNFWTDLTTNSPTGTRYSLSQGCRDAGTYCFNAYTGWNLGAEYQEYNASYAPNVIGTQPGGITPEQVYIVIGHLDDLPSSGSAPGADDNASGSVTVLETAKVLSCYGFKSTIKYINCTGEEQGLYGSEAYADDAFARGEDIRGVINFDMNGWEGNAVPNPENLDLNYNAASEDLGLLFAQSAADYATGLVVDAFLCPSLTASDHAPFWENGYKAVCGITDNEGYCSHDGNYPYYHESTDTIAHCGNPAFFYSTIKTTVATLATLAEPFKITFQRPAVPCDGVARLIVADRDLNSNSGMVDTMAVEVWSNTESTPETFVLTEQGVDSMYFAADIPVTTEAPLHGDGKISTGSGENVTARYIDALDCDGTLNRTYTAAAITDCVIPVISAVGETGMTDAQAVIVWTTDEISDSSVIFGPAVPPQSTTSSSTMTTSHQVTLTGLQECTVYYYEVRSTDQAGNTAVSNNGGQYFHFETMGNFGGELRGCHEGQVNFSRPAMACSDTLTVELSDMDLNIDSAAIDSITVTLTSTTEFETEDLVLSETGPNTSQFRGSIPVGPGAPVHGDGRLSVAAGDLVTATYHDADDGTGHPALSTFTGTVDCAAAVHSGLTVTNLMDTKADVRWYTSETATSRIEWGTTPALGNTLTNPTPATFHTFTLSPLTECTRVYFRITTTDAYGNVRVDDNDGELFQFNANKIPGVVFKDSFEAATSSWTLEGEWQTKIPQGKGGASGGYPDPTAPFHGNKVLGHDLTGLGSHPGDYENGTTQRAQSPTIDGSSLANGQLKFRRWLNTHSRSVASIEIYQGGTWHQVWRSSNWWGESDNEWSEQTVDISEYADGNASLRIGFKQTGGTSADYCRSGWNIDKLVVRDGSLPDYDACGSCGGAPGFAGLATARDLDPCAPTGIVLTWPEAVAWGTGHKSGYAVYRDTDPWFTPGAGNLLAHGVTETTYTDSSAPAGMPVYYIVRAENDETCGSGPHNLGMVDSNLVRVAALDESSQLLPGSVGESLRLAVVNGVHVRLNWESALDAATYHVLRSLAPQPAGFSQIGNVFGLLFEDQNEAANAISYFYLIRAADSCGNEGP